VRHEVGAHLRDASAGAGGKDLDPLLWWKEKRNNYPRVSLSTSTTSERVFSICGFVNSAKRNRLKENAVAAQVFLYNNLDALDLPRSELLKFLT